MLKVSLNTFFIAAFSSIEVLPFVEVKLALFDKKEVKSL